MDRLEFRRLVDERPVLLDGATGTELMKRGLPPGAAPEKWIMENPAVIQGLHREYYAAGSDIVLACTFGANRLKLADHGLAGQVREMNTRLVEASRAVVPAGKMLFGDMSPTGQIFEPFGPMPFEEAVEVYREQARALLDAGVDGFMIETMMDIQEARAALIAVRDVAPGHPVIAGMTFEGTGRTLSGITPAAAVVTLQALGADAVGCNCSTGPEEMLPLLREMLRYATVPVFIKPNAGMPCVNHGKTEYNQPPETFANAVRRGLEMGAGIAGGCCGTTPGHIGAVRAALDAVPLRREERAGALAAVSSARAVADFSGGDGLPAPLKVIGERINPTGKKAFQAELLAGDFGRVLAFAEEQAEAGADLLDVNLGLGGLNEPEALRRAVGMLAPVTELPLAIDSVNPDTMEAALRLYPGRALVNSISAEKARLERMLPVAARYGAMIIVLPVAEGHIPATVAERMAVAREVIEAAEKVGIRREDMLVDGLAMTISADPMAAGVTLSFIDACHREGLRTLLGLSNVSFGMPERKWLNAAFMAMAMGRGLSAVIANPAAPLLMEMKGAADALDNRHGGVMRYIDSFANAAKDGAATAPGPGKAAASPAEQAGQAVLKGNIGAAAALASQAVAAGTPAGKLVADFLVPSIVKAGELFEKKTYFLPQLMLAGEAMRLALEAIEPALALEREAGGGGEAKGKVVMATVKGDVHDIGKNLVSLMLRNHGFDVVDLGKDVPPERVAETAARDKADIIGLSALMTTTLASMRETIAHLRGKGIAGKIMVGGAAVTENFAQEAGADGYSADAVTAVRLAEKLVGGAGGFVALR